MFTEINARALYLP